MNISGKSTIFMEKYNIHGKVYFVGSFWRENLIVVIAHCCGQVASV